MSKHTKLRNTVQGDSQVVVYCQRLKSIVDELRELGDPINDRQLIKVLLVGISGRLDKQASFIPMMRPPPSFDEVRSMLQWADHTITTKEPHPQASTPTAPCRASTTVGATSLRLAPEFKLLRQKPNIHAALAPSSSSMPPHAPPASLNWRPSHDPWTGLVQACQGLVQI
jgi:hypothetical protein